MAYTYLGLVNDVCVRTNDAVLTSSNFPTAVGFYSSVMEGVNSAIRTINQEEFEWPFNHFNQPDILSAGVIRYFYPIGTKTIDFDSFRIERDSTFGNETKKLRKIDYEEYLESAVDDEYNTSNTGIRSVPRNVFQTPDLGYGVWPAPDNAYTLSYEGYSLPVDLKLHSDVPSIPEAFRHIIVDGAMIYAYLFRDDIEKSDRVGANFKKGIKNMRSIYVNRYDHVRDTRILRQVNTGQTLRVV